MAVKIGLYGATPVAKAGAYTQTYSTADKTISALSTSAYTIVASAVSVTPTNSSPWGYSSEAEAQAIETQLNNLVTDVTGLKGKVDNVITDITDCKQALNALIDDLQAIGIVG
jgi:peptidoglycan hydrolase CwlO-like protein